MAIEIEQLEDGIYFRLPEAIYHGQQRLSASGCANLLVSPGTFWADSWLNPDREVDEDPTIAQILGSAYHTALLEPDRFDELYVCEPDPADYPKLLTTGTAIGERLAELGEAKKKAGEKVEEQALRLWEIDQEYELWPLVMSDWEERRGDRTPIKPKAYAEIRRDTERLRNNEELLPLITDGQAEVSVLWTDKLGVQWKARIDWLKLRHVVDKKTFDNPYRKILEKCLSDAIAYNRYYIQAFVYWTAAEKIRAGELPIKKVQRQEQKDLIEAIRKSADPFEYWWVFQQKGGVPNVLARQLRMTAEVHPHYLAEAPTPEHARSLADKLKRPSRIWDKARAEVEHCRNLYLQCLEIWGEDKPWGVMMPVSDITDENFAPFFLEE